MTDTTTHDSNVVKKGGNDEDRTTDDSIGKEQAIDKIKKRLFETAFNNVGIKQDIDETLIDVAENRLENWFDELPSAQPEIIRCKDCKHHWTYKCMDGMPLEGCDLEQTFYDANIDYCSLAERRENATD